MAWLAGGQDLRLSEIPRPPRVDTGIVVVDTNELGDITLSVDPRSDLDAVQSQRSGEGIAQVLFIEASEVCKQSYADKKGKYQNQPGLTLPFVVKNHK